MPLDASRSPSYSGIGKSRRSMSVTSAPAARAPSTPILISFLFHDSVRVLPAKARILGAVMMSPGNSFTDHFDEHPLAAAAVKLTVEDLLPGAEIELARG